MARYKILSEDAILPRGAAKDVNLGIVYQQGQLIPEGAEVETRDEYVKALVDSKKAELISSDKPKQVKTDDKKSERKE